MTFSKSYIKRKENNGCRLKFSKLYKILAFCVKVDKTKTTIGKFGNHEYPTSLN